MVPCPRIGHYPRCHAGEGRWNVSGVQSCFQGNPGLGRLTLTTATFQAQARGKQGAFGSPTFFYKNMPSRTKMLGPPNSAASSAPNIRPLLQPSLYLIYPQLCFLTTGTSISSLIFYSKCCNNPQPQSTLTGPNAPPHPSLPLTSYFLHH